MEIITNADQVQNLINKLNTEINAQWVPLYDELGHSFIADVQERIISQDKGAWAEASKWIRAKKDPPRPLFGAEKFVKYKASPARFELYGDTGEDWTLTQHHEGFINKQDHEIDGRIVIDIINPGPLGLKENATKFSWVPEKGTTDKTPARKIWPDEKESQAITLPIASHWLQALVQRVLADNPTLGTLA